MKDPFHKSILVSTPSAVIKSCRKNTDFVIVLYSIINGSDGNYTENKCYPVFILL